MPSGYTSDIYDGKDVSLRDFILTCARGMGFLLPMRDDSRNAEIPKRFDPSPYHRQELEKFIAKLSELDSLTSRQIRERARKNYQREVCRFEDYKRENESRRDRYQAMLLSVRSWDHPKELDGLFDLMIEQIEKSTRFDVNDEIGISEWWPEPHRKTGDEWLRYQIKSLIGYIAYHSKQYIAEIERTEERNRYLDLLWTSLPEGESK